MNKARVEVVIAKTLGSNFTLVSLQEIRKLLDSGALLNMFSDAVDRAIETKKVEIFQREQEN